MCYFVDNKASIRGKLYQDAYEGELTRDNPNDEGAYSKNDWKLRKKFDKSERISRKRLVSIRKSKEKDYINRVT